MRPDEQLSCQTGGWAAMGRGHTWVSQAKPEGGSWVLRAQWLLSQPALRWWRGTSFLDAQLSGWPSTSHSWQSSELTSAFQWPVSLFTSDLGRLIHSTCSFILVFKERNMELLRGFIAGSLPWFQTAFCSLKIDTGKNILFPCLPSPKLSH